MEKVNLKPHYTDLLGAGNINPEDTENKKSVPIVVVDGTVFVATIGATVAAGVTVLNKDFCLEQETWVLVITNNKVSKATLRVYIMKQ